ncbi:MAG: hypothetical protein ACE5JF_08400, partial [Anaerolineales bacterium]
MRAHSMAPTLLVLMLFACSTSTTQTGGEVEQSDSQAEPQPAPPTEQLTSTPEPSPTVATANPTATATLAPESIGTPITLASGTAIDIGVIGSATFVSQTENALALLASCAPVALQTADSLLEGIQESERSGMLVGEGVFLASETTAFAPGYSEQAQLYWFAGAIVHDAHHRAQSQQGRTTNWAALTLEERETLEFEAREVQINVLDQCSAELPASTQGERSFMLQYLTDMQAGITECDYC